MPPPTPGLPDPSYAARLREEQEAVDAAQHEEGGGGGEGMDVVLPLVLLTVPSKPAVVCGSILGVICAALVSIVSVTVSGGSTVVVGGEGGVGDVGGVGSVGHVGGVGGCVGGEKSGERVSFGSLSSGRPGVEEQMLLDVASKSWTGGDGKDASASTGRFFQRVLVVVLAVVLPVPSLGVL